VVVGCRKWHNEELHDLYTAPDMARMIKYGRMRWRDGMHREVRYTDSFI
jgi:hypothetical protein